MLTNLFQGEQVRLTAIRKDDIPILARWEEDSAFLRLLVSNAVRPRTETKITGWLDEMDKSNSEYMFAIRLIKTGKFIGMVGFDGIEWNNQVAGISIGIGKREHWGKGYGFETMQLALAYGFNELNLHRLQLGVFSYNSPAIALYEKCGFKREGVQRDYIQREGQRYDMYLYGLLRPEWVSQRS